MQLSEIIAKNTATVNEHLLHQNLPTPSFDLTQPPHVPIDFQAKNVGDARIAVLEATTELNALMKGPVETLESLMVDVRSSPALLEW